MDSSQHPGMDATMPVRDHNSCLFHRTSDADILDHRKQDTVYIGLHLPRRSRPRSHNRPRRYKKASRDESKTLTEDQPMAAPPSVRVQFIIDEDEDEDHKSHEIFCEMAELFPSSEDPSVKEWKETARWVKFEEDVEEGGERWSKPHVATLSLHSLFELRYSFCQGSIMLDMHAETLEDVIDMVLDNLIAAKQLESTLRDQVRDTLLARHRHQNEKRMRSREDSRIHLPFVRSLADIGKKYSVSDNTVLSSKSSPNFGTSLRRIDSSPATGNSLTSPHSSPTAGGENGLHEVPSHKGSLAEQNSVSSGSSEITSAAKVKNRMMNLHFMKKLPPGAETSNILVGEVDFLNHQIMAFVRLSKATLLGDITEVPVPTRFIYILLGPTGNQNRFHEMGRSIATIMTDEIFHDVAYHAHNREDLLTGIDEFLDQVTVLPPGEWDPTIRIEPPKTVPSQNGRKMASSSHPLPNGKVSTEEDSEDHKPVTLERTGRLFGGLHDDIKRKIAFYKSDFTDALHMQCVASFIFLYFACLTPIITFGGLLGDATDNSMAAMESLLAGCVCGVVYALFAGQPLTILGSTGPVLVFETILKHICVWQDFDYLEWRLWIGIWTGVILLVIVAFDLSAWVKYITRFTEESFAALISLIFIYESFSKLFSIASDYPVNRNPHAELNYNCSCNVSGVDFTDDYFLNFSSNVWSVNASLDDVVSVENCTQLNGTLVGGGCDTPVYYADVFFFSVLLFIGTFTLCYFLKRFRNGSFCRTVVRSTVSDFAVLFAIVSMVIVDYCVGVPTPKLEVPDTFSPTNPERGWVIPAADKNPVWSPVVAVLPAFLAVILVFMDQQITAVIVNRKENKLQKGYGYHLDLLLVGMLIVLCSVLGLPWFVAATVLSISHVNSLKKESQCSAPGEQPRFLGVREQRVTGIAIFLLIGISVLFTSVLKLIPMPVLYGVFLYMGVSSLNGMQLVDRVSIFFMPAKYQPDYTYLRNVRTRRVHLFTAIQVFCLVVLCAIKMIQYVNISFPIMVLTMCFIRGGLSKLFTQKELKYLDDIIPEANKRAKEDEKKETSDEGKDEEEGLGGGSSDMQMTPSPAGQGSGSRHLPRESVTLAANLDQMNISEEMRHMGLWKSIMHSDSQCNMATNDRHGSSVKHRKSSKKHHHRKSRGSRSQPNGDLIHSSSSPAITSDLDHSADSLSPAVLDVDKPVESQVHRKKKTQPVRFYIEEEEEARHTNKGADSLCSPVSDSRSSLSSSASSAEKNECVLSLSPVGNGDCVL